MQFSGQEVQKRGKKKGGGPWKTLFIGEGEEGGNSLTPNLILV